MKTKINKAIVKGSCTLIIGLFFNIKTNAQIINFTGDWKVNLEKSDFNGMPKNYAATEFKITQNRNVISFERIIKLRDSTTHSVESLNFDGSITTSNLKIKKKESSIKWSEDKVSLIETAKQKFTNADGTAAQFQSIETFSLSEDRIHLFYVRQVISPEVNFTVKAQYEKVD